MRSNTSPQKPITVSIVSHGQLELIRPLLEQLDQFSAEVVEKVVLTINIPEADAIAGLQLGYPIERIENAAPMGFGANHNQAFRRCATDWFLVLNPDIRFDDDVLAPLTVQATPDAGLLAPRIMEPDKVTPEQHRALITPLEILTRRRPGYAIPAVPDWIPGLFMMFRRQAFAAINGFDERFFMYGEDFDICARTRLAGWKLQIAEGLRTRHDAQRASHRSKRHLWWHASSLLRVWGSGAFWRYRRFLAYSASNKSRNTPSSP
ncbi:glycosyltransferase family 2 protein [Variovorax sp. J22R133]|uniref:glycosyltransferase family 2 protein n=1 Tax=Variovorax brevis TaxID=3053503 RepID=UPI002578BB22|nr:glycosyltransferase family 2 protein [Variovorax sp. J22R133]MDM0114678.1 glycosyltransferase family 2 protein [Variovorax sp. J22R133]